MPSHEDGAIDPCTVDQQDSSLLSIDVSEDAACSLDALLASELGNGSLPVLRTPLSPHRHGRQDMTETHSSQCQAHQQDIIALQQDNRCTLP